MLKIRNSVFETNSSSCHSLSLVKKDDLVKLKNGDYVIHFDDTGEYNTTKNQFQVMTYDEAFEKYKKDIEAYNSTYNDRLELPDKEYDFSECVYDGSLFCNDKTGRYLNFDQLMQYSTEELKDTHFELTWWNNE